MFLLNINFNNRKNKILYQIGPYELKKILFFTKYNPTNLNQIPDSNWRLNKLNLYKVFWINLIWAFFCFIKQKSLILSILINFFNSKFFNNLELK